MLSKDTLRTMFLSKEIVFLGKNLSRMEKYLGI